MVVASQAAALLAIAATSNTTALFAGCVLFGLSAGNLLTLPALVIQREFDAASFGVLVGAVVGDQPVHLRVRPGLMGILRDVTGSYTAPLVLCAALDLAAAALILLRPTKARDG